MPRPASPESTAATSSAGREREPLAEELDLARARIHALTEELAQSRATLAEQQNALEQAIHTAEAAAESRDRFISNVSHELRTPLSAILLWSGLIDEQTVPDPQLAEALQAIKRSAEEQSALIDDIVDTTRLLAGKLKLEPEPIDVAAVLRHAMAVVTGAARAKQVRLIERFEPVPPGIRADARRLRQLVSYLLHNAVRFTPADGSVTVTLGAASPAGIEISVQDTGAGIAPDVLPGLLDRQPQIGGKCARSEIGLGLGLVLARRIAELHGGQLRAESAGLGQGAAFTVDLPPAPPTPRAAGVTGARPPLTNRTVLLIGVGAAAAVGSLLRAAGARVECARSAEEGWVAYSRAQPHLIVASVGRTSDDGAELMRRIRQREEETSAPGTPAVALTASEDGTLLEQALEAGFQTCLAEPLNSDQLLSTLGSLLSPARAH